MFGLTEYYFIFFAKSLIWLEIWRKGAALGLIRKYSYVYVYFALFLAAEITSLIAAGFWHSFPVYKYVYLAVVLSTKLCEAYVILRIYRECDGFHRRRDWPLVVALPLIAVFESLGWDVEFYERIINVTLLYVSFLGLWVIQRAILNRGFYLGRNLGAVLASIVFSVAVQSLNQAILLSGVFELSSDVNALIGILSGIISLALLFFGLREYDPPRIVGGGSWGGNGPSDNDKTGRMMASTSSTLWRSTK